MSLTIDDWLSDLKNHKKKDFSIKENKVSSFVMSIVRVFLILGDLNVRNYINKTSCCANPGLKYSQVLSCGNIEIFRPSLEAVREESNVVIVSCVTNFLASSDGPTSVPRRVEPVLQDFLAALVNACTANPTPNYAVSPPMYRNHPVWYKEGLPEILTQFSQTLNSERPPNLHLLPSFPTPKFEDNGVHLTSYSGLEFVLLLARHRSGGYRQPGLDRF